ncbi:MULTISPECIES: hypothetical protein [Burkholderia]|uniref:hypothetical protein n=1 Tax=Burkholderia TaxID=32008 RepID=UPI001E640618|nr:MULTISPECIES: hypothetical protein [unclassified Burkholderia]UEP32203.1 hypothetical protein LMA01_23860 [Burkholderia sp. B21-007]UEP45210.1 hypothetical protein LMA02_20920 [Burkholderia sp. B21-005]
MQIETFILFCNRLFPLLKSASYSGSDISDRKKYGLNSQTFGLFYALDPARDIRINTRGRTGKCSPRAV